MISQMSEVEGRRKLDSESTMSITVTLKFPGTAIII